MNKAQVSSESDVGISEYFSCEGVGFTGVLKHFFSDFQVHEIGYSGDLAELSSIAVPQEQQGPLAVSSEDRQVALQKLLGAVGNEALAEIEALSAGHTDKKNVLLDPMEKEARTQVHQGVRACFPTLDTMAAPPDASKPGKTAIVVFPRAIPGEKRKRQDSSAQSDKGFSREPWAAWTPDYVSFTLYKRNADTQSAVLAISQAMHINPAVFTYAGKGSARLHVAEGHRVSCSRKAPCGAEQVLPWRHRPRRFQLHEREAVAGAASRQQVHRRCPQCSRKSDVGGE